MFPTLCDNDVKPFRVKISLITYYNIIAESIEGSA